MTTTEEPTPVWTLSGFGDEIHDDPAVQVAVLQALGAAHIEVRSAWATNVVDLTDDQVDRLARLLEESGMAVSAIASPIGKVPVRTDSNREVERLRKVIGVAHRLGGHYVRVFSFYPDEGQPADDIRDAVLERMSLLADEAARSGVVLLHENEKGVFGDIPRRVLDIVQSVDSPALRLAWDAANYVQVGVDRPHDTAFATLRPYTDYVQIKDARRDDGAVVPAGRGDGQIAETVRALADDGYDGFVSLEPHLMDGHELGGFSGPRAFGVAARALAHILEQNGVKTK